MARSALAEAYNASSHTDAALLALNEGSAAIEAVTEDAWRLDHECFDKIVAEYTTKMQSIG